MVVQGLNLIAPVNEIKQKQKMVWSVKNLRKFDLKSVDISQDSLKVGKIP